MNRKYLTSLLISVLILLLISFLGYYIYSNLGYKEYKSAIKSINALESENKTSAKNMFFQEPKENRYGGTLGYVSKKYNGVLLWTEKGPKVFRFNDKTMFYVYYVCTEENLNSFNSSLGFRLMRTFEASKTWYKVAEKGMYAGIVLDKKGNVIEADLSDIWSFLPVDLNESCPRK